MGQPSHWTYCPFTPTDDLQQGDIIWRSGALLRVLSEVLSHFCDECYTAFLVLTQSCDLVRRSGELCKAEYVNLCVIRELEPLLPAILEPCCGAGVPGVFASDRRWYAEQLLKRILNQNEQGRGLLYLHPDADAGVATASVALLRVSIALRREHYPTLQQSRCGRLAPEYAAKLGWLAGNLYSRVATPDWEDQEKDKAASIKRAKSLLRSVSQSKDENWVPVKWMKAAREKNIDLTKIPPDRFRSTLADHAPPELLDAVLGSIRRVGRGVFADNPCNLISTRLADHEPLAAAVSERVAEISGPLLSAGERTALVESLAADPRFRKAIGNQVGAILKQNLVERGGQAIGDLSVILTSTMGMLMPATNRLRTILSGLVGAGRAVEVDQIVEPIGRTSVFNQEAVEIVMEIAREVFLHVDFGVLDKLISRLKNDQNLGAACREALRDQPASLPLLD